VYDFLFVNFMIVGLGLQLRLFKGGIHVIRTTQVGIWGSYKLITLDISTAQQRLVINQPICNAAASHFPEAVYFSYWTLDIHCFPLPAFCKKNNITYLYIYIGGRFCIRSVRIMFATLPIVVFAGCDVRRSYLPNYLQLVCAKISSKMNKVNHMSVQKSR